MQPGIEGLVVGLLVHGQAVGPGLDQAAVFVLGQSVDLDADGREIVIEDSAAIGDVIHAGNGRCITGENQDVLESAGADGAGFGRDFFEGQLAPVDAVFVVEAAVQAAVGAEIGQIQRGIEHHGAPELGDGQGVGLPGHGFQMGFGRR